MTAITSLSVSSKSIVNDQARPQLSIVSHPGAANLGGLFIDTLDMVTVIILGAEVGTAGRPGL